MTENSANSVPDSATERLRGHGFGTMPVFLAAISTILGAILFLRFGYAVGNVGLVGALGIVLLGHLVTIPTSLALAEIATNRRVEGGGEYYIISRSFGHTIGTVIGVSLYVSQAISVAFYMIAFAEAFRPLAGFVEQSLGVPFDPRFVSVPGVVILTVLALLRGAALGVRALYVVVAVLLAALLLFFVGAPVAGFDPEQFGAGKPVSNHDRFFVVFAIVFPAFTGMTAGVGLSGDLANPRRSIPRGTLAATLSGMLVYIAVVFKLAYSAPPERLAGDELIMADIALWGPAIYLGLACATLSSAIGSVLVAPRTLQALAADEGLPISFANRWLAQGVGDVHEPRNATLLTGAIALFTVAMGSVDLVARLISMFFMVTYGSLCAISFLEHFAARPSYRPSFRTRWYLSLFGAVACFLMMFQMDPLFAVLALITLVGLYRLVRRRTAADVDDLGAMFQGAMSQLARFLHLRLQRRLDEDDTPEWRPSVLMVSDHTFERSAPLQLMSWICHRQGFGTYLHYIEGKLDEQSYERSVEARKRLTKLARQQESAVYVDTLVSPSLISALAQSVQIPGVAGTSNNTALFEVSAHDEPDAFTRVADECRFANSVRMALLVLRHGDRHFGQHRSLHVWLTWNDSTNATLMVLLSYILVGHPEWHRAEIQLFAALPRTQVADSRESFMSIVEHGRLPIAQKNVRFLPVDDQASFRDLVARYSADADLTLIGFDMTGLDERGGDVFRAHPALKDVLFVHAPEAIQIT